MAFKPGQSGNPSGRPKILLPDGRSLKELAREHTQDAFKALVDVLTDADAPKAAVIAAAKEIIDRGWGRAAQPVIGGDEDDAPISVKIDTSRLSDAALREIAAATEK